MIIEALCDHNILSFVMWSIFKNS